MHEILIEGPFESDYSLAIVNRLLARGLVRQRRVVRLHQRDNTTNYFPSERFLQSNPDLAPLFVHSPTSASVHSRYIFPPYTDGYVGRIRVVHCYGWEESSFPEEYVRHFNRELNLITVMSDYVQDVLRHNGVSVPIRVVGLGADHILQHEPTPVRGMVDGFSFLHVSSCFPRKGVDVLIRAFCEEFHSSDPVQLIIKTFENPHNNVKALIREADAKWPEHAPIQLLLESLCPGNMRWLYEHAGCLVSPSRGEGFGLPVAEAMFVGCPVIATMYSGQADLCSEDNSWPVAFTLEKAKTHLSAGDSLWAEPDVASLRQQMRAVYRASNKELQEKTSRARDYVMRKYTWDSVSQRHWNACEEVLEANAKPLGTVAPQPERNGRIGFITSWNSACGIAEYTRYLVENLPPGSEPFVFASRSGMVRADEDFVNRCWEPNPAGPPESIDGLIGEVLRSGVAGVSVQFNFSFFSPAQLERLIKGLKTHGIVSVVTMHATKNEALERLASPLSDAAACLCHRTQDMDAIRRVAGKANIILFRQGIPQLVEGRNTLLERARHFSGEFLISSFGFLLPPKGIHQLIQAFALVRRSLPLARLRLVNALYPLPVSDTYLAKCIDLVQKKGLGRSVSFETGFLDDTQILKELAATDLVVLPYTFSSESSSAAIRLPIASGAPVLCSDLEIFNEFRHCVHRFPAGDPIAMANEILRLAMHPDELQKFRAEQDHTVRNLSWKTVAAEFAGLFSGLLKS